MSLDQHIYGSTDWHLPSPSSTPKSATFPEATLKTPRTEGFPQSHFLDAWATPQVHDQHTPVQTPSFTLSTPIERPSSSYSPALRTPEDPEFHVNHFAPQNLHLPPVAVARRLSSSPDPNQLRKTGGIPLGSQLDQLGPVRMDLSQMQTPPPTRDASSRRSLQQSAGSGFATPATVIHRTPHQAPPPEALFDQTPFGLVNVQYTPDLMPFPGTAPMSAPPMPHSRLFWDQANDVTHMDVDMPYATDPFGPTPHRVEQHINWQAFQSPAPNQMHPQSFQSFNGMSSRGPVASFAPSNMGGGQTSRSNSFASTTTGVDPNMLFSFSNQGLGTSFGNMPQQTLQLDASRQPYETQARESLRDRETVRKAKSQHSRSNTNSSSGSTENLRSGLQRSNTDSGFRKNRPLSMESRVSAPVAASTIPRRSSPLKRQSSGSLTAIPEIRRPRTRLIIDETGRARTETVIADEEDTPRETRRASQTDIRRQYPGLWEEDETESDDDEVAPIVSRNPSFAVPPPQRRASKHARADSGGLERANSFKIPRPSSRTSSGAFDKASFETVRSIRQRIDHASRRLSMMDTPTLFDGLNQSDIKPMPESPGDALGALKKVVAGRQQRIELASQNTLKAHNQRWAQASADMSNTTTPHGHGYYDPFSNGLNGSPNTDGLTTPSTDRSRLSHESTRCVCNGVEDGQHMVQCESCAKWLHLGCIGYNAGNLPPVYVCIFCTGNTPIARGGRVRGPIPFDSPLTHKSMFRR